MSDKNSATSTDVPAELADFERIFNALPSMCAVISVPDYRIVAVTDSFCAVTYRGRDELVGLLITDALPESPSMQRAEVRNALREAFNQAKVTKRPLSLGVVRYDIVCPDKMGGGTEEHWWRINDIPVLNERGEVAYIIHSAEEVTQVLNALEELEIAARRRADNF